MAHEEDFDENQDKAMNEPLPVGDRTWMHPSELPPNYSAKKPQSKVKKISNLALVTIAIITALSLGIQKSVPKRPLALPPSGVYPARWIETNSILNTSILNAKKTLVSVTSQGPLGVKHGYGVIIRSDGIILTTSTILKKSKRITIKTSNGISTPATLLGTSHSQNISLIRIGIATPQATDFSSSSSIKNGQRALVNLSHNMIAVGKILRKGPNQQTQQFIGTHIPPTESIQGSLLLNAKGHLSAILGSKGKNKSNNAYPVINIETLRNAVSKIFEKAHISRGWLGVKIEDIDQGSNSAGIVIKKVAPTSPAAQAGLVPLETITSLNGRKVTSVHSLIYILNFHLPGQTVVMGVKYRNKTQLLKIRLINSP